MNQKKKGLGRGLNALLSDSDVIDSKSSTFVTAVPNIPINSILANPFQPRSDFDEESLQELAESVKNQGIIQPVTVRKTDDEQYQLISGERRLRAAKIAGLTEIPAYVREVNDGDLLELALVENIQRENLNAIEIACSLQRLIEECNFTQESLGDKIGKKRTTVINYLRLLKLPPEIQIALRDNLISMGHARAIINIEDPAEQLSIFRKITEKGLSVRQVEELARQNIQKQKKQKLPVSSGSEQVKVWCNDISQKIHAKVRIKVSETGKGQILIQFKDKKHLADIIHEFKK